MIDGACARSRGRGWRHPRPGLVVEDTFYFSDHMLCANLHNPGTVPSSVAYELIHGTSFIFPVASNLYGWFGTKAPSVLLSMTGANGVSGSIPNALRNLVFSISWGAGCCFKHSTRFLVELSSTQPTKAAIFLVVCSGDLCRDHGSRIVPLWEKPLWNKPETSISVTLNLSIFTREKGVKEHFGQENKRLRFQN